MIPWRREWLPTPVFLPREFHGQRSLVGHSSWSCKESDMTEPAKHTHKTFSGAASLLVCGKMRALLGGHPGSSQSPRQRGWVWRVRAGQVVEHGVFSLWSLCQGKAKPDLEFSFRELVVSGISEPHRNAEWGEAKPRIETDSSARRGHSLTLSMGDPQGYRPFTVQVILS